MSKPKFKAHITTKRDLPVLTFIWRYKVVPSSVIGLRFFPNLNPRTAWIRLNKLRKAGYLELIPLRKGHGWAWGLTKKGFNELTESLPPLGENGFESDAIIHDLVVLAAHIGDSLIESADHIEFVTDRFLKTISKDSLPHWVPNVDVRRPDGYWRVHIGNKTRLVALEVELNWKSEKRYRSIAQFYSDYDSIDHVIWVTSTYGLARSIQRRMKEKNSQRAQIHSFVSQDDFKKDLWSSQLQGGILDGRTARDVLAMGGHTEATTALLPVVAQTFFNYRVLPIDSRLYKDLLLSLITD